MGFPASRIAGVILAILSGACGPRNSPEKKSSVLDSQLLADQTMERMHVQSYGPEGLEWDLAAPRADVFSAAGKTIVQNLRLDMFSEGKKSTTITADEGVMLSSEKNDRLAISSYPVTLSSGDMFLSGHVVMVSTEGNHLSTDWAHYKKKEDLIVSYAPVKVIRPDSTTHGIGLEATADLSKIKIFNQTLVIKGKPDDAPR